MSTIHINRAGQNLGIFNLDEVQAGLNSGRFSGTDLAWRSGMETWKPLAQWEDLKMPLTPAIPPVGPGIGSMGAMGETLALRDLPSWEQRSEVGFFTAFGSTVREVLLEPSATFARMKETGGFGGPALYLLLTGGLTVFFSIAVNFILQGMRLGPMANRSGDVFRMMSESSIGILGGSLGLVIIVPIFIVVLSFISAGFWHLSLMILGGANKPFEATYRVFCYAKGSTSLLGLVPCCGWIAVLVWNVVAGGIGLAKVHGISTGKAVTAILLPLILCCGLCGAGTFFGFHSLSGNPEFSSWLNSFRNH